MRAAGKGDVAVMNNGGIRADAAAGAATYGSLFEIQPFGNMLYRVTVRGATLRAYLERVVVAGPAERPRQRRRRRLRLHAPPRLAPALGDDGRRAALDRRRGTYTLVLNDFLATGGDGLGLADERHPQPSRSASSTSTRSSRTCERCRSRCARRRSTRIVRRPRAP